MEIVVAVATVDQVSLIAPVEVVVVIEAIDAVGAVVVSVDVIDATGAVGDDGCLDVGVGPSDAIAELELLDLVAGAGEVVVYPNAVGHPIVEYEVVIDPEQGRDFGGGDVGEFDRVEVADGRIVVIDGIDTVTLAEAIGVVAFTGAGPGVAPPQGVVAGAADDQIVAGVTIDRVVACAAEQRVIAGVA